MGRDRSAEGACACARALSPLQLCGLQPRAAPVEWQGRPAESGRGLSVPGSGSQPTARSPASHPLQPEGRGEGGKRAFVSDLKRQFQNGFLFFILFFLLSLAARKREKMTPRIHFKRTTKRRRGSSQMLMFCFFDINLRTHMGVFIDSCSHLLNFPLFI